MDMTFSKSVFEFCCPICKKPLISENNSLVCGNKHCFDRAKSGYVNLLPSNKMNSKTPGDNKLMVDTRNEFLSKGYYAPMRDELCRIICDNSYAGMRLLDAGCGEGYYTSAMAESLPNALIGGIDISKLALNIAAKRTKQVQFSVASVFSIPVSDKSCDVVTELFAPYCGEEFYRVLKDNGVLLLVIPSTEHLFELKQAVYSNPYRNEVKSYDLDGFKLIDKKDVFYEISIDNPQDIQNLFCMTPYYYKTSKEDTNRLMKLEKLQTKVQFELLKYEKIPLVKSDEK